MAAQIVCLHGLGRTPSDWDGVTEGLAAIGPVSAPALPRRFDEALCVVDGAVPAGAVVIGHSMGGVAALRVAASARRPLAALVLANCAFPPRRNGRSLRASLTDYGRHRVAFAREMAAERRGVEPRGDTGRALASFARMALGRSAFRRPVAAPVLVVHTRDDHHVPVDFALAAVQEHPDWEVRVLDRGGHHPHVTLPADWLAAVVPWLGAHAPA